MDSTQGFGLRQPQRWQSFQVERGKRSDRKVDAVLLWGVDVAGAYTDNDEWWTEREEIREIPPSKWISDLYETWQEENKSCLWSSNVQSSFLSFTICVSFWNLWCFSSFILMSPQVCGSELVKIVYICSNCAKLLRFGLPGTPQRGLCDSVKWWRWHS